LNQPGEFTWPIVQMTYIYVRKDLTTLGLEANEQSLLVAFLKSLYNDDYRNDCIEDFGFTRPSPDTRTFALDAIESLIISENATEWIFESSDTLKIDGAADFVLSKKRNNFLDVSTSTLTNMAEAMQEQLVLINQELSESREQVLQLEATVNEVDEVVGREYTDTDDQQLKAALILGSLSFALWFLTALMWMFGRMCKKTAAGAEKANGVDNMI
jgi:hypothetical protein